MPFRWTSTRTADASHACSYCFARPTHTYLDLGAGRDFEKEIVVKVNLPEVLRTELARPSWKREHVAMGTNTDPYQWVEGRYKLMPDIWRALAEGNTPASVLTKSPLLLRDLELMKQVPQITRQPVGAHARGEDVAGHRAAHPPSAGAARGGGRAQPGGHPLRDPDRAADAGDQRRPRAGGADPGAGRGGGRGQRGRHRAAPAGRGARASSSTGCASKRPDLLPRYERLYARGAYAPRAERERLAALTRGDGRRFLRPRPHRGARAARRHRRRAKRRSSDPRVHVRATRRA